MNESARAAPVYYLVIGLISMGAIIVGCGRKAEVASQLRSSTPDEAAASALQTYDKDGDGALSVEEIQASPSLAEAVSRLDSNNDGSLDSTEIAKRFERHDALSDLVLGSLTISSSGAPLSGADVTFQPAPFMGEGKQSYVGTSGANGKCELKGTETEMLGLPTGFYDVHIVHGASGTDVTLGCEVAEDISDRITLDVSGNSGGRGRARRGR